MHRVERRYHYLEEIAKLQEILDEGGGLARALASRLALCQRHRLLRETAELIATGRRAPPTGDSGPADPARPWFPEMEPEARQALDALPQKKREGVNWMLAELHQQPARGMPFRHRGEGEPLRWYTSAEYPGVVLVYEAAPAARDLRLAAELPRFDQQGRAFSQLQP